MRCLYVDLDGTLLGPGGSLLRDAEGGFTHAGVRALEACQRAGVEVVIFSGRREAQVMEDARLLGHSSYIFEIGAGLVIDGELEWLTDGMVPGELTIHDQITQSGAPDLLLGHFAGRLEYHTPWHLNREVSHIFRGVVDGEEAASVLEGAGLGNLRLVDNGTLHRSSPTLPELEKVRCYHLLPAGASKGRAVARHRQARGYAAEDCIAVGDSREDMAAAEAVGTFWLVGNAAERDPELAAQARSLPGVRIAEGTYGAGVYEAVVTTLAERR